MSLLTSDGRWVLFLYSKQYNTSSILCGDTVLIQLTIKKQKIMGFLDNLQVYAQRWEETARGAFSKADRAKVDSCVVVESEYGLSACFHLVGGGAQYMPLSNDVELDAGDVIDLDDAEVITLSRPGDKDIYRLSI